MVIWNEKCITKEIIVNLPTNNETFSAITGQKYELARNEIIWNKVSELYMGKWLVGGYGYQWCIVYIKQEVENVFVIDHLHQMIRKTHATGLSILWRYSNSREKNYFLIFLWFQV